MVVIDSAEKLGEKGLDLVASLGDMIGRDGTLRPFTLLVGQLELREALKNATNTVALQIVEFHAILTRHFHPILTHPYSSPAGSRCG